MKIDIAGVCESITQLQSAMYVDLMLNDEYFFCALCVNFGHPRTEITTACIPQCLHLPSIGYVCSAPSNKVFQV